MGWALVYDLIFLDQVSTTSWEFDPFGVCASQKCYVVNQMHSYRRFVSILWAQPFIDPEGVEFLLGASTLTQPPGSFLKLKSKIISSWLPVHPINLVLIKKDSISNSKS